MASPGKGAAELLDPLKSMTAKTATIGGLKRLSIRPDPNPPEAVMLLIGAAGTGGAGSDPAGR
jgi:hypothetical protein